jgi:uncharacterized protein (TIGR03118 family)
MDTMRHALQEFSAAQVAASSFTDEAQARPVITRCLALVVAVGLAIAAGSARAVVFEAEPYVTDDQAALQEAGFDEPAPFVDENLINPFGVAFSPTGPFWIANQGSSVATVHNSEGEPQSLVVSIPSQPGFTGPTGVVFNSTSNFILPNNDPGLFFFANLDGSIAGWNDGTNAQLVVSPGGGGGQAMYTGITIGTTGGANFIYAANNLTGKIDVYDQNFDHATLAGNFTDPNTPSGFVPFNVQNINGLIYVTYATPVEEADEQPLGSGFVSVFNLDGSFVGRLIDMGGKVSSPWGLAIAPDSFGQFAGALLVGNFSDEFGFINAFDPNTGDFLGQLTDEDGDPIMIPYLWTLTVGNGGDGGDLDDIYFTAGIGDKEHGVFGEIEAVPLPAALMLLAGALGTLPGFRRRRRN